MRLAKRFVGRFDILLELRLLNIKIVGQNYLSGVCYIYYSERIDAEIENLQYGELWEPLEAVGTED